MKNQETSTVRAIDLDAERAPSRRTQLMGMSTIDLVLMIEDLEEYLKATNLELYSANESWLQRYTCLAVNERETAIYCKEQIEKLRQREQSDLECLVDGLVQLVANVSAARPDVMPIVAREAVRQIEASLEHYIGALTQGGHDRTTVFFRRLCRKADYRPLPGTLSAALYQIYDEESRDVMWAASWDVIEEFDRIMSVKDPGVTAPMARRRIYCAKIDETGYPDVLR